MSFQNISNKQWKQLIQYQLNGATYGTQTPLALWQEINISPFYSPEMGIKPLAFNIKKEIINRLPSFFDYIMHFSSKGNYALGSEEKDIAHWKEQYAQQQKIAINACIFSLSGANAIQEIAYSYGVLLDYLRKVKVPPKEIIFQLDFSPHIYFEIAKIKAFRLLFVSLTSLQDYKLTIIVKTSDRYCSSQLLKNWAMQGMLVSDADFVFNNENSPTIYSASNAIFFTDLAQQMARRSLQVLKNIEKSGGYIVSLKKHIIQRKLHEKRQEYKQLFGTTEKLLTPPSSEKTIIEPLLSFQIS